MIHRFTKTSLILLTAVSISFAHDRYILPPYTVVPEDGPRQITLRAGITEEPFQPELPLGSNEKGIASPDLEKLFENMQATVMKPNGDTEPLSWQAFAMESVADLGLTDQGTYRVAMVQRPTMMTTFKYADGKGARYFGPEPRIPADATEVVKRMLTSRTESYLTLVEPDSTVLRPSGKGLEIFWKTHPNNLYTGEQVQFTLLHNGEPVAAGVDVTLTRKGIRHHDQREDIVLTTNAEGSCNLTFKIPGFYHLQVKLAVDGEPGSGILKHHNSLFVTLEVFTE
jgi:uncharacterized GH25 family protein